MHTPKKVGFFYVSAVGHPLSGLLDKKALFCYPAAMCPPIVRSLPDYEANPVIDKIEAAKPNTKFVLFYPRSEGAPYGTPRRVESFRTTIGLVWHMSRNKEARAPGWIDRLVMISKDRPATA
jgi:hypothetical protein